jgi:hypothetical protein
LTVGPLFIEKPRVRLEVPDLLAADLRAFARIVVSSSER